MSEIRTNPMSKGALLNTLEVQLLYLDCFDAIGDYKHQIPYLKTVLMPLAITNIFKLSKTVMLLYHL